MNLTDLRRIIEKHGLRTVYDTGAGNLVILSSGYQQLGKIDVTKQFAVDFNRHFQNNISRFVQKAVFSAVFKFVETPMEQRDGVTE